MIDKLMTLKINNFNEFTYSNTKIIQSRNLININKDIVNIVNRYEIILVGAPYYISNQYRQLIVFVSDTITINTSLYKKIYIDSEFKNSYMIIYEDFFYIVSDTIINTTFNYIYTINNNYLVNTIINGTIKSDKKLNDIKLLNIINTSNNNNELLVQDIQLSKISSNNNIYKYNISNNLYLESNFSDYYIKSYGYNLTSIDNIGNKTLTTHNPIDDDNLQLTKKDTQINLFINNLLNMDIIINYNILFANIKQLKTILIDNSNIEDIYIYNNIKPWKSWSLLNSIISVNKLSKLVNLVYLEYENNEVLKKESLLTNIAYSYITHDELITLTSFLKAINKSPDILENYLLTINIIEPAIINNLNIWLNHSDFFINVVDNINNFLLGLNIKAKFDGNNIIFSNDPYPDTYNNEISSYISQEFTYNTSLNIVYRSKPSYDKINSQILNWINKETKQNIDKNFGINIHQLLRYLRELGDNFNNLINNFSNILLDSPEYLFNNPLKFIVNKVWDKTNTNLQKLNNNYSSSLEYRVTFDNLTDYIVSSVEYFQNLSIIYTGLNSLNNFYGYTTNNYEKNLTDISIYYPSLLYPISTNINLLINSLYSFSINLNTNQLIKNSTYSITFLNGQNIASNIKIVDINGIYSNQLNFYLNYNIKPNDFFIVKQSTNYTITNNNFIGYLYEISFNDINNSYINDIKLNNSKLNIISYNDNVITLTSSILIEINNQYELISYVAIKNIKLTKLGQELEFYSDKFNYIEDSTLLKNDTQTYILHYSNNIYYITGEILINKNIAIINFSFYKTFKYLNQVIYQYELSPSFNDTKYVPINNNKLPALEFKLSDSESTITPIQINSLGNNQILFYFNSSDQDIINSKYNTVIHNKHLNEKFMNIITNIKPMEEYLYYFNYIIPATVNTVIFVYDNSDNINPDYITNKQSIYFNQNNNKTYFTIATIYNNTAINNIRFIQKNTWIINKYTINNGLLSFKLPSDFVLNTSSNYEYKINDTAINKPTIIFNNGIIIIPFNIGIADDIIFKQYYIERNYNKLIIPDLNQKVKISYNYPFQYSVSNNYYILPYTNNGEEYNEYLYLIKLFITDNEDGYVDKVYIGQQYKFPITLINLSNIKYSGYLVMKYYYSNYIYYLISLKEMIDTNCNYTFKYNYTLNKITNNNTYSIREIIFYQNALEFGNFYYQESLNDVYLFMRNYINNYSIINFINTSNFYLVSYDDYDIKNIYNQNVFVQNSQMSRTSQSTTTTFTSIENPIFNDYSKLFKSYSLYFNDQLAEEINEDIINIDTHLYHNENDRQQLKKMTMIRFNGSSWEVYMPLIFWFCGKPGLSIPSVAMPYTDIILKYKLNDLKIILKNDLSKDYLLSLIPQIKIKLITEFILLDSIERNLFGSYSHEYVINRYKIYPNIYIKSDNINAHRFFTGLVKDIYLISKPLNSNLTYYTQEIPKYDYKYERYIKALEYYNLYILDNVYTTSDQMDYVTNIDIEILLDNLTWEHACEKEKEFISLYGRIDKGTGILANLTDGGDGTIGLLVSKEKRGIMSNRFKGENNPMYGRKLSKESIKKGKLKRIGIPAWNKGKTNIYSESCLKKMSESRMGQKAWNKGMTNVNGIGMAKLVIDLETGIYYESARLAAIAKNMKHSTLKSMLNGTNKNITSLLYV
jgi:hypothetical protein